jgi:hypothetical protein
MNIDYFGPPQLSNNIISNSAASGTGDRIFYDEDAGSSAASTSPVGDFALSYPQGVNPTAVCYAPTQVPFFMNTYDYYNGPTYNQAYVNQQAMPYTSSTSSEEHLYFTNGDINTTTSSPSSSMSSVYTSNVYLNNIRETPLLTDSAVHEHTEYTVTSPVSGSSYQKKKIANYQSAFSHLTLADPAALVSNDFSDKQHLETKKPGYFSSYKQHQNFHNQRQHEKSDVKKTHHIKKSSRNKGKKKCSNCHATDSPSWRRSICKSSKGDLVCNACGL